MNCPVCGSIMIRCENVEENHDDMKCVVCGELEPICDGKDCRL